MTMKREILVDACGLEPPEPMERLLAVLDRLAPDVRVRFRVHREPFPLYTLLERDGWQFQSNLTDDGYFELLIERAPGR